MERNTFFRVQQSRSIKSHWDVERQARQSVSHPKASFSNNPVSSWSDSANYKLSIKWGWKGKGGVEHGISRRRRRNKSLRLTDKWLLLSDSLCWKWSARGHSWRPVSGRWHWAGVWTDIVEKDWVWWAELNFYGGVLFRCCAPICLATPPATDPFSGGQGKWWMFTGLRWWATIKWVGLWRVGRVTRVLWGGNGTAGCWFVLRVTGSVRRRRCHHVTKRLWLLTTRPTADERMWSKRM